MLRVKGFQLRRYNGLRSSTLCSVSSVFVVGAMLTLTGVVTPVSAAPGVVSQDAEGSQDRPRRGVQSEFPSAEAVMERLEPAVESGRMTREQMEQVMQLHRRFAMGIENGRMSSQEASTQFGERVRAIMSGDGERQGGDGKRKRGDGERKRNEREMSPSDRLSAMMLELGNSLKTGAITPEEAVKRVMAAARRMRLNIVEEHVPSPADEQRDLRAQYAEAEKRMAVMLEKGEITREQMEQRLSGIRRRMEAAHSDSKRTITKADYDEAAAKMTEMVKAGEISRADMQARLDEMKRMMTADGSKRSKDGNADREAYMERISQRLKMAVEKGDMTREEAGQKYAEMEREYDAKQKGQSKGFTRADYRAAQEKMQKMVDKGEITQEEMDQRLIEMRKMMGDR